MDNSMIDLYIFILKHDFLDPSTWLFNLTQRFHHLQRPVLEVALELGVRRFLHVSNWTQSAVVASSLTRSTWKTGKNTTICEDNLWNSLGMFFVDNVEYPCLPDFFF